MIKEIIIFGLLLIFLVMSAYIYYEKTGFELKCVVSKVNGNEYCVRERNKINEAADLLGKITEKCKKLIEYLKQKYPDDPRVKRLAEKFNPDKITETLPTSKYTAYSENKGEKLAFCLNTKKENDNHLIDEHTLMFVSLHELAHIMTISVGHEKEFWDNFKFLLQEAKEAGIHEPLDYSKPENQVEFCSMNIHENPYFEGKNSAPE